jgi:antitoxin HicB
MLQYPLKVQVDDPGWLVTSRDIPQLATGAPRGTTKAFAAQMGYEAFKIVCELLMEQRKPIPMPSEAQRDEKIITVEANVEAKIRIYNAIIEQGLKASQIAEKILPVKYPMTKLIEIDDPISLDALGAFSRALDLGFTFSLQK